MNRDDDRAARLAAALRDNLRRRKAQARMAATTEDAGAADAAPVPAVAPAPVRSAPDAP